MVCTYFIWNFPPFGYICSTLKDDIYMEFPSIFYLFGRMVFIWSFTPFGSILSTLKDDIYEILLHFYLFVPHEEDVIFGVSLQFQLI